MHARHATILAVELVLLTAASEDARIKVMAQQRAGANLAESQAHDELPRDRANDTETVGRKSDAQVLADLSGEAEFFRRMLEEYGAKVRGNAHEQDQHLHWLAHQLRTEMLQITAERDVRNALERLIRCVDHTDRDRPQVDVYGGERMTSGQYFVVVATTVCVSWNNIDEPLMKYIFGERGAYPGYSLRRNLPPYAGGYRPAWDGVVLAAIESYRDQRAVEFLLKYALRESREEELDSMSQWALMLLRGFAPEKVKPPVESALKDELRAGQASQGPCLASPKYSQRASYLQDCLSCLEYALTLSREDRTAYEYFERSCWWSYAFAKRGMIKPPPGVPDWRTGNERFVVGLLKLNVTRIPSIPISVSDESVAWLFQQLDSRELSMEAKQRLATMIPYLKWRERQREDEWREWHRKASNRR